MRWKKIMSDKNVSLRSAKNSSKIFNDKLEMSCKQPSHLDNNLALIRGWEETNPSNIHIFPTDICINICKSSQRSTIRRR
jgi:hypothetical protein